MKTHDDTDHLLDARLEGLRATDPVPSADFMARILADAEQVQSDQNAPAPVRAAPSLWRQFMEAFGGWPAMGGLVTGAVVGLWLGINPPQGLEAITGGNLGPDSTAFLIDSSAELALGLSAEAM